MHTPLTQKLYYAAKPLLPWRLRMALRRVVARRLRRAHADTWPISETAARPPAEWSGWPEGRRFAFVLSHDVEGPVGLAKCRQLAEIEAALGFRSSFNFIPEGPYEVPVELRSGLTAQGFEVGVHDLEHDGRLFGSRKGFKAKAVRINRYLQDWKADGFRSGFMLRNLGWLHELDLKYDCSTFDTDPFEFQPDGANTIFPFWIASPPHAEISRSPFISASHGTARLRGGYVELPYTLPQDSTLFLVLKETTPEIWLRKLDWIVEHGGMAFVNVHPDYLQFDDERPSPRTFPVRFYKELLLRVRERYAEAAWHKLPREVALFMRQLPAVAAAS